MTIEWISSWFGVECPLTDVGVACTEGGRRRSHPSLLGLGADVAGEPVATTFGERPVE